MAVASIVLYQYFVFPSILAVILTIVLLAKGLSVSLKKPDGFWISQLSKKFPDNYYILKNIKLNNNAIDFVIISPKGIFTIEKSSDKAFESKFIPIKQAVMHSKALNDFMQQNKIGNFHIKTIIINDVWNEKLKENFPDIPILKPNEVYNYIMLQDNKYQNATIQRVAELLELNLRINDAFQTLRKDVSHEDLRKKAKVGLQ